MIVGSWSSPILGAISARIATAGEPDEIFCQVRTISPISRRPNFTKFEHNTAIDIAMKTFGTEFLEFYREGSLKNAKTSQKFYRFAT